MKALITAGGRATRLRPITHTINKHLIPLAGKPMIAYALEKVAEAGITEVAININPGETELQRVLGNGNEWGIRITYLEQKGGPKGLAHIVDNARSWIGNESFVFYLGDNIILGSIKRFVEKFHADGLDCLLALSKVQDPQRFGVAELQDGRIVRVTEKPAAPVSDLAVTGIYIYKPSVFSAVAALQPSTRGEYEISDAHTWLIEHGYKVGWEEITGWWKDTGKPEDLLDGNRLMLDQLKDKRIAPGVVVEEGVIIDGPVEIGAGTVIGTGSVIRGPVAIGKNCSIRNSTVGPYVSISDGVTIDRTQIERSLIMEEAVIECGNRIVDSIFGRMVNATPNKRPDRPGSQYLLGDNAIVEF